MSIRKEAWAIFHGEEIQIRQDHIDILCEDIDRYVNLLGKIVRNCECDPDTKDEIERCLLER